MIDIENIKQKYCMDDDVSKKVNSLMHIQKAPKASGDQTNPY